MCVAVVSAHSVAVGPLAAPELAIVETRGLTPIPEREAGWLATDHVSAIELTNLGACALAATGVACDRGRGARPASQ
jgi:hypothetical protein